MNISMRFRDALPAPSRKAIAPLVDQTGAPLIPSTLASFECENSAPYDGGIT
jgi:hypothetical protein